MPQATNLVPDEDMPSNLVPADDLPDEMSASPTPPVPSGTSQRTPSPFQLPELPKKNPASAMDVRYPSVLKDGYKWGDKATVAAQKGVDVASGGDYGLRNMVALGTNDTERVNAIRKYFGDRGVHAPSGTEIGRIGPESGVPEFYDSGDSRYKTVSSMSPVPFNETPTAPGMATTALTTAGAGAGSGAFLTGAGAFAGRYLAEQGKHVVAQSLGLTQDYKDPGVQGAVNRALVGVKPAAIDAGFSLVGSGIANAGAVGKYLRYGPKLFQSDAFNPTYWGTIQQRMKDASKQLDDFYSLAGDNKLKLDVAQLADHPAVERGLASSLDLEKNMNEYAIRGQDNTTELQRVFNKVTDAVKGDAPPLSSGPEIQQWALNNRSAIQAQQQLAKDGAQESAVRATDGMPQMTPDEINKRITGQLQIVHDADKGVVDKAWGDVAVKLGKPAQLAYSKDSDWLLQPQTKTQDFRLTPEGQTKLETLIKEATKAGRTDPDFMGAKLNAIPGGFIKQLDDGSLAVDANKAHDLYDVLNTVKSLRSSVRADMKSAKGAIPPDEQDMARVAEILRNDITTNLRSRGTEGEATLDAIQSAEQATKDYAQRWRSSLLSDVAKKSDGFNYPVTSDAVHTALFQSSKDGGRAAAELADISKGDPSFQDSIRHNILAIYKSQYTQNGLPTPQLHQQFLTDMGPALSKFFTPTDMAQITHVGNLGDVVTKRTADMEQALQAWKKSPLGKLGAMNSATISKAAFSNAKGVQGIGNFLRQYNPELLKQLQSDTASQIALKVVNTDSKAFNQTALAGILDPVRGRGVAEIMPKDYLDGLKTIYNTSRLMTGVNNVALPVENTLIHRGVRLLTGAFGKEARAYHLIRGFRERQASRMMYNTLSDPDNMTRFMSLKNSSPQAAKAAGFLGTVGAEGLEKDDVDY